MKNEKKGIRFGNIFWGIFLILAAAVLIISKLGFLQDINLFSIFLALFFVAWLINGIIKLNFWSILFPVAFLCIIFDDQLGITSITPWTVLVAAFLGTLGLEAIFKKKRKNNWKLVCNKGKEECDNQNNLEGKNIFFRTKFGDAVKYIVSEDFEYASLDCTFGDMKVYFDDVIINGETATIDLNISFGDVTLFIPKEWTIVNQVHHVFADVQDINRDNSNGMPKVFLTGKVSFGELEIVYI